MLFLEKNDDGIELHLDIDERELLYRALRHYSAYGEDDKYIVDEIPKICEILNVLEIDRFKKKET